MANCLLISYSVTVQCLSICRIKSGWQKFYVVLESHELSFFTDHKVRDNPSSKPLSIYCVLQSTISPYTKDKKKSVFQVNGCTCVYIQCTLHHC